MKNNSLKFKILPHIADLKIRACGKTKKEVFLNALKGMGESQRPEIKEKEKLTREIRIKSTDLPSLLVDFLSETLYLSQVKREAYFNVKFRRFLDNEIEAELIGQKAERFGEDIKAVTFHGLEVEQKENGIWEAIVLFDV